MANPKMKLVKRVDEIPFQSLGAWAKSCGKSRSAARKLYLQDRVPGARPMTILGVEVVGVPIGTPWPAPAKHGSLTKEQRAAWPKE